MRVMRMVQQMMVLLLLLVVMLVLVVQGMVQRRWSQHRVR